MAVVCGSERDHKEIQFSPRTEAQELELEGLQ